MSSAKMLMISLLPATLASAVLPVPLGRLAETPVLQQRAPGMHVSDRFSISGLDYSVWAAMMIAEGKLVEPTLDKTVTFRTAAGSFDMTNFKCGVLASSNDAFQENKEGACALIREAAQEATKIFTYAAYDDICDGAAEGLCISLVDGFFTVGGALVDIGLGHLCPLAFDEIFDKCPGGVGGTAEITLTRDDGQVFSGSLGAMNFEDDTGVCPANPITATEICREVSAN